MELLYPRLAPVSGVSETADFEVLTMFVNSLRGVNLVRLAASSTTPFEHALRMRERPLMVMDVSLLNPDYMGLDYEQAWHQASRLLETCRRHQGDFVLLWHNNNLASARDRALYLRLLGALAA